MAKKSAADQPYGDLTYRDMEDEIARFNAHLSVNKHGSDKVIRTLLGWVGIERLRQINDYFDDFGALS